ncbi:type II secretion system protein GspL [Methylophilus sp. 3sh_L]|uniref:type II secretion system protein GspL n=1 Tax=Methylophilus sp. 3sh_L TaxID=3377114 RepID=UPI00398F5701
MTRLILSIDEHWPSKPECSWVLLEGDNKVISEGNSSAHHWPTATTHDVVLVGSQCLWLEVALPKASKRDTPRLIKYALEDKLIQDPETQHLTVTHRRTADDEDINIVGVLVVGRERMRQVLNLLSAVGRNPDRILSELQTAPLSSEGWQVSLSKNHGVLRMDSHKSISVDVAVMEEFLEAQLATIMGNERRPNEVLFSVTPGVQDPDFQSIAKQVGVKVTKTKPYIWWKFLRDKTSNLLHGEFELKNSNSIFTGFKAPLLITLVFLSIWGFAILFEVAWLSYQQKTLNSRIEQIYQNQFPNSVMVAPASQINQHLNVERSKLGYLRDDDALALLAKLIEAMGANAANGILEVNYNEGLLDVTLTEPASTKAEQIVSLLSSRGHAAQLERSENLARITLHLETQ